jgi:hypothetical protein
MRFAILILALATLTACAQQSVNHAGLSATANAELATDTVRKLEALYPPASTHILLSQATEDAYGEALEKKLRERGYALQSSDGLDWLAASPGAQPAPAITPVQPSAPHTASGKPTKPSTITHQAVPVIPVTQTTPAAPEATNLSVGYLVDQLGSGLYRVTITADARVVSRVYTASKNHLAAAGAWSLKE